MSVTPTVDRARLADAVITARHRRRMTQRQLAEAAGVAPNTVVRVEAGKTVREASLAAMLEALEVDLARLADRDADAEADTACDLARAFVSAGPTVEDRRSRMLYLVRAIGAYA